MDDLREKILAAATEAKAKAIAPYSKFRVGAAIAASDGKIFNGCNIESSSFGLTCCAERVAIYKALSEGQRSFVQMAIAADTEEFCTPCGACRQVLWDYARNIEIILINIHGATRTIMLDKLLPEAFDDRLLHHE